jgi:pimeloyl-ACP methyl ester carboxylesterase
MQVGAECGSLSVPLDYSHPNGQQIQLAVSRIQHTSSNYQGVLLSNPGGPGGSGLNLNVFLTQAWAAEDHASMVSDYDWIGFDPRGVGSSVPVVTCDPNYFNGPRPQYIPFTRGLANTWLSKSRGYAQNCASQNQTQTALLAHLTTADSARDMDSIRQALGQSQITYYGYSYGTYLGQVYASLFPSHVRRMVLDSNVDPRTVWYQANLDQDAPFNRNEDIWFAWLAKYDNVYHLGSTEQAVARLFYSTEAQLMFHPAGGVVGPDEWVDAFLFAGYYQFEWVPEAQLFASYIHNNDVTDLVNAYESADGVGNDNGYAMYLGVECVDNSWPTNWSRWSRDNWRIFSYAPFETWANAWFNAPCIYWPAPRSTPVRIDGRQVQSTLLVDETLDAATPFEGSLEVRRLFPHSVLIAEPGGTTHAETPAGDSCVDDTINAYLENGTLPPRVKGAPWDQTCAPPPVPVPPSGAAAAAAKGSARAASSRSRLTARSARARTRLGRLGLAAVEIR